MVGCPLEEVIPCWRFQTNPYPGHHWEVQVAAGVWSQGGRPPDTAGADCICRRMILSSACIYNMGVRELDAGVCQAWSSETVWACSKQQCRWWQLMEKASQLRWLSHDSTPHHSPMIGTLYPLCWLDTAINDDGKNKTKTNNINLKCHEVYFLEKTANVASMHKSAVWSIFTDTSTSASPL